MDCCGAAPPLDTPSNGQPTIGRPFYVQAKGQLRLTCAFYAECASQGSKGSKGSACLWQAGSERKVLRMDRPDGRRVRKFDGAFGPEGCGIALTGDEYKVSVTGFAFSVI